MKKVDFLVCGTQKGGTSALDRYLRKHEQVGMANVKEVHFFDKVHSFSAKPDYKMYHKYFDFSQNKILYGEVTPVYMYWQEAPRRIYEYNQNMKIILLLRNPIERAYSQWNMEIQKSNDSIAFFEAISNEQERSRENLPLQHRVYSYVDRGFYVNQIKRMWHFFGKENVLILKSEELKYDYSGTLNRVADFLKISQFSNISSYNEHARAYKKVICEESYNFLYNEYYYEIKHLEKLLEWDCSKWLQNYHEFIGLSND